MAVTPGAKGERSRRTCEVFGCHPMRAKVKRLNCSAQPTPSHHLQSLRTSFLAMQKMRLPPVGSFKPARIMKSHWSAIAATLAFAAPWKADATTLVTEQFVIVIVEQCLEGDVACNNVKYTGVSRSTGESLTLQGRAWVRMCPDTVTPCQHVGWVFKKGEYVYRVRETPPTLEVERNGKTLLEQKAIWADY